MKIERIHNGRHTKRAFHHQTRGIPTLYQSGDIATALLDRFRSLLRRGSIPPQRRLLWAWRIWNRRTLQACRRILRRAVWPLLLLRSLYRLGWWSRLGRYNHATIYEEVTLGVDSKLNISNEMNCCYEKDTYMHQVHLAFATLSRSCPASSTDRGPVSSTDPDQLPVASQLLRAVGQYMTSWKLNDTMRARMTSSTVKVSDLNSKYAHFRLTIEVVCNATKFTVSIRRIRLSVSCSRPVGALSISQDKKSFCFTVSIGQHC